MRCIELHIVHELYPPISSSSWHHPLLLHLRQDYQYVSRYMFCNVILLKHTRDIGCTKHWRSFPKLDMLAETSFFRWLWVVSTTLGNEYPIIFLSLLHLHTSWLQQSRHLWYWTIWVLLQMDAEPGDSTDMTSCCFYAYLRLFCLWVCWEDTRAQPPQALHYHHLRIPHSTTCPVADTWQPTAQTPLWAQFLIT